MWGDYQKNYGGLSLKEMTFFAGFAVGAVGSLTLFWRFTTLSGEDMVDRTILLI